MLIPKMFYKLFKLQTFIMKTKEQMEMERKATFNRLEKRLNELVSLEDRLFYHHPNEDHIILSHALFWVMTKSLATQLNWSKTTLLLRMYQEKMLEAYLTESDDFDEWFRYCNLCFEMLPYVLPEEGKLPQYAKVRKQLVAISIVAAGFGGDISEDRMFDLLDDIDFRFNKVYCRNIEEMLPVLNEMVREQLNSFRK